jgi:hypothetical protein
MNTMSSVVTNTAAKANKRQPSVHAAAVGCLVDDSQAEELLFWRKRGDAWEPEIEPQPEGEDDEVEMEDGEEEEVEG